MMSVSEALSHRRSVRAFTAEAPPPGLIRDLVTRAGRAPSGGNLQPWHIYVVEGGARDRVVARAAEAIATHPKGTGSEYSIYPAELAAPYRDRRFQVGEDLYQHLGIPREDKRQRATWFAQNFRFFDAPVGLFCYVHRNMGLPQWSDLGMYLQSLMLLLVEHGLASCPQECWAMYPDAVSFVLTPPADLMLFTGMSIGYEDVSAPANRLRATRASPDEFATFLEA